jgi:hypothetical protein
MTDYQRSVADAYLRFGPKHKLIARAVGTTPDGARSTLRKLRLRGDVPAKLTRIEWPVPRP